MLEGRRGAEGFFTSPRGDRSSVGGVAVLPVGGGQHGIDIDPRRVDAKRGQPVALRGEVLLLSPGTSTWKTSDRRQGLGRHGAWRGQVGGDARFQRADAETFKLLATLRTDAAVGTVDDWQWTGPTEDFPAY